MKYPLFLLILLCAGFISALGQNPCYQNESFRVVILGSSTAAGTGPSSSDSTWVNRYRKELQKLNPNNEVINLAVGGFTTYRIMPHEFVSPIAGRPAVDSNRNITEALSRNPDVIIVNLPSNDRQWPMREQLSNFDSLWNQSWNNGVPIYICTTQPLGNPSNASYQYMVHDSILDTYGNYAIEFYDPLADTANVLLPQYNSGDNVHLNDAAHRILMNQVLDKGIQDSFLSVNGGVDLMMERIRPNFTETCLEDEAGFYCVFANLGTPVSWTINISVSDPDSTYDDTWFTISTMPSCSRDSVFVSLPVESPGLRTVRMINQTFGDTTRSNDTLEYSIWIDPRPEADDLEDTICLGDSESYDLDFENGDTLLWYANMNAQVPFSGGDELDLLALQADTSFYIQAVSGPLTNVEFNGIPFIVDRHWNGVMFDLVADEDLTIDSLLMRFQNASTYEVEVMFRNGSYKSYEQNAGAWTLWGRDTVLSPGTDANAVVHLPVRALNQGDTLGLYFFCSNAGERVAYSAVSNELISDDGQLQIISGSGISHTFGQIYFPRAVNVGVYYHYGVNYEGYCSSERELVSIVASEADADLGGDQVIWGPTPYFVAAPIGFDEYYWIDCLTGDTISTSDSGVTLTPAGVNTTFWLCLSAFNDFDCEARDSVRVDWVVGIEDLESSTFTLFPNPAEGLLNIELMDEAAKGEWQIIDLIGREMSDGKIESIKGQIDVSSLPVGQYFILISSSDFQAVKKFTKK